MTNELKEKKKEMKNSNSKIPKKWKKILTKYGINNIPMLNERKEKIEVMGIWDNQRIEEKFYKI